MKQTVVSVNGKKVKSKCGGLNPPILNSSVVSVINRDSKQIRRINNMSRQTQSIFTSATQATGIAPIPTSSIESMGVTKDFSTLEIRATLSAKKFKQTLFVFHGGSCIKPTDSKKGLFFQFMPRPFIFTKDTPKQILVSKETGELQHSSVKAFLVKATESIVPETIKPLISMLAATPAEQREVAIMIASQTMKISQEEVIKYLYQTDSLEHQEISLGKFVLNLFKHENVKVKSNIPAKWNTKIENIIDRIFGEKENTYSIVLRFDLTKVNAIKELVELQAYNEEGDLEARRHPLTGDIILLQEVTLPLTYIGIEKGSTYDEDTTKYLNPMRSINAAKSATKDLDNPVYMDYSIIEARAEKVNAWKEALSTTTGKKFLQKTKIVDTLYKLAESYASGDKSAIEEANSIHEALKADDRVGEEKANSIWSTFQEKVQERITNQPEPIQNNSTSEGTSQEVNSQEDITDNAVDMLSSPAFSLDALLGMNLAIDED